MITLIFLLKFIFFNEVEEGKLHPLEKRKLKIKLKFELSDLLDLLYEEETIYTIETSIKEEREKSTSDINFNKDLIKIHIGYIIYHPLNIGRYVIDKYYADIWKKSFKRKILYIKKCL